ncbi:MAG: CAP domain-containing protein [Acidobacteriota bacterium]
MSEKALLKIISVILSVLCVVANVESSGRGTRYIRLSGPHADVTNLEKKIHNMINKERKARGLPVLLWDESLHIIARKYSQDMAHRNFFSHDDPEGRSFCDRYRAARFECSIKVGDTICLGAENISQDNLITSAYYKDGKTFLNSNAEDEIAESVVKRWMSSKSHRRNILTPYFKRQGIGVALSEDGKVYITEDFC